MAEKYITKSDVINHLQKIQNDKLVDSDYRKFAWGMEIFIDGFPSADVEPVVHAKWIPQYENRFGRTNIFECSECNKTVHTMHKTYKCSDLYCSNCGAKMDGGN